MSHECGGPDKARPPRENLRLNVGDADARQHAAVSARLPESLAALLLEHAQLWAARLAVHHADHLGVGDKRRARDDVAGIFLDEEHLFEGELLALFTRRSVDFDDGAG